MPTLNPPTPCVAECCAESYRKIQLPGLHDGVSHGVSHCREGVSRKGVLGIVLAHGDRSGLSEDAGDAGQGVWE